MSCYSRCYHCAQRLGVFSPRYKVMQAVKPKGAPYRWKEIGAMCESCEAAGCCTSYDPFSSAERFKQQVEKRRAGRKPEPLFGALVGK